MLQIYTFQINLQETYTFQYKFMTRNYTFQILT